MSNDVNGVISEVVNLERRNEEWDEIATTWNGNVTTNTCVTTTYAERFDDEHHATIRRKRKKPKKTHEYLDLSKE